MREDAEVSADAPPESGSDPQDAAAHAQALQPNDVAALERELLGGERRYDRAEIAAEAGVDEERAQVLWRELGIADVADGVKAFPERDVWALRTVARIGEEGWLDDDAQVAMTRAMGQSLARLAEWQLSTVGSMIAPTMGPDQRLERARELVPVVE